MIGLQSIAGSLFQQSIVQPEQESRFTVDMLD